MTYLRRYIPHDFYSTTTPSSSNHRSNHDTTNRGLYDYNHRAQDETTEKEQEKDRATKAQFMLRFMIKLWIQPNASTPTTDEALQYRRSLRTRTHRPNTGDDVCGLESSYDLALNLPLAAAPPGAASCIVNGEVRRVYAEPCGQV